MNSLYLLILLLLVTVFVLLANNDIFENVDTKIEIASVNIDKEKSILGAPPKVEKKKTRNPMSK